MKKKEKKALVKVSRESLVAVVASQIKGKDLFPEKMEEGKKMLDKARLSK